MLTTLMMIIGASTLFFTFALVLLGAFDIVTMTLFVVGFNVLQWLAAPYLVDAIYGVKEVSRGDQPDLYDLVEQLSIRSGIPMPRVMLSHLPIPNAFAYGSPLAGTRIAVTAGLLRALDFEEVEAIVGHELGHIKHRDVQIMMFVSMLPALLYYLGYSLSLSARYSRGRERNSGAATLGSLSLLLYFVLTLLSLRLSRLREYYADRHSVAIVDDGARKLSEGLAKVVTATRRIGQAHDVRAYSNFKALFITDPGTAVQDTESLAATRWRRDQQLVQHVLNRNVSTVDSFFEMFSTHPHIVKRLRAIALYDSEPLR
jgi:heat shock protein HtpX